MSDSYYLERAQSAEAKYATLQNSVERIKQDARDVLECFSARKKSDGTFDIDYEKFIERLGRDACLELKKVIDEQYGNPDLK
jgi:hypothetical protein